MERVLGHPGEPEPQIRTFAYLRDLDPLIASELDAIEKEKENARAHGFLLHQDERALTRIRERSFNNINDLLVGHGMPKLSFSERAILEGDEHHGHHH